MIRISALKKVSWQISEFKKFDQVCQIFKLKIRTLWSTDSRLAFITQDNKIKICDWIIVLLAPASTVFGLLLLMKEKKRFYTELNRISIYVFFKGLRDN